jgi:hypothetical protein
MASRLFVLPEVGSGTEGDPFRPKYLYDNSVTLPALRPEVTKFYGGETFEKAGQNWHTVRVFSPDPTNLDWLAAQPDVYDIDLSVLVSALNSSPLFPVNLTPREWALLFSKILMRP